ncbi:hypothetical protein N7476_000216 [Penicillium atrosanguineum]|uniref:Xylanolytic transcriptional activator regulatory domain-containing protein n=2 Tax=Penicillium atrosanguineum TaxID=1132637 RepID=A0A9W9QDN0_9EURO|nr:hypothetical protein N7476_000216 [Penicillium atrosanguineum]
MPGAIDGKSSGDNLLVRHIFCLECANSLGLSLPTAGGRRCPACQTLLSNPDDTVSTNLNPTDDYKTSVLSGLDPNTIMECTGRALGFWAYQSTQEIFYQDFLGKSLTEKYSNLNTQMDKVIHNANSEMSVLQNKISDIQAAQEQLEKKNQELADLNREKSKKLSQMTNLYNLLKARAMRTEMQTAASDTVSQTLNNLSSRNSTMLPPIQTHVRPPPITTKARSRQGHTPKTRSYHLSPEGVERLHRYQRSGTGNSRRAGEQDSSIPMAPLGRLVWNTKSPQGPASKLQHRTRLPAPPGLSSSHVPHLPLEDEINARFGRLALTAGDSRPSDRLTFLEEKVDLILNGGKGKIPDQFDQGAPRTSTDSFEASPEPNPSNGIDQGPRIFDQAHSNRFPVRNGQTRSDRLHQSGFPGPELQVSPSTISDGIEIYFDLFHRQPIWCFNREELEQNEEISTELVYSILELTARFMQESEKQRYGEHAKWSIMLRVANGTVELETIESLCLLSYSAFIDGNLHLGQFYLGFGLQLCRSARIDRVFASGVSLIEAERKKRLLWSFQSLDQFCSEQEGILGTAPEIWRQYYISDGSNAGFPRDHEASVNTSDIGIWSFAAHFGWVPWCHRYDVVKFFERKADEVKLNRDYWVPWIKLQFTWHAILTTLNHPFLYIVASQHHPNLAVPNNFWRKSSELVLLHATWIIRMIDMVTEKEVQLVDPFYGHAAAIAATVHLYFCCATDLRLKQKSKMDFEKCKRFLKNFASFSPACATLVQMLEKLAQIASGSESMDFEWAPSKLRLSIPLMWNILQFNVSDLSSRPDTLLHSSLATTDPTKSDEYSTLEINVALSPPEITIDPSAGQNAYLPPFLTTISSNPTSPKDTTVRDIVVPSTDSLMFNVPWLWTGESQFSDMESASNFDPETAVGNIEGFSTWWDFGNL